MWSILRDTEHIQISDHQGLVLEKTTTKKKYLICKTLLRLHLCPPAQAPLTGLVSPLNDHLD